VGPQSDLALSLAAAAHGAVAFENIAGDILDVISSRMPIVGAALNIHNPISGCPATLCSTGFEASLLDHLRSRRFLSHDICYRIMIDHPATRAVCWRDVTDYRDSPSAVEVFRPAGLGGGASVRLTTADGRYTGDLHIGTTAVDLPAPEAMTALQQVAPILAAATDVTRRMQFLLVEPDSPTAALRDSASAPAVVVSRRGKVVALPLGDLPPFLENDRGIARQVVRWRERRGSTAYGLFYHFAEGRWWRLRLVALSSGSLVQATATEPPGGLTMRELEVLTVIAEGRHNEAIAHRLGISERTCAHHVERIMSKLGIESRAAAARLAVEEGLRLLR
jgi:DNA-binding CsgD family transcriptional regulator